MKSSRTKFKIIVNANFGAVGARMLEGVAQLRRSCMLPAAPHRCTVTFAAPHCQSRSKRSDSALDACGSLYNAAVMQHSDAQRRCSTKRRNPQHLAAWDFAAMGGNLTRKKAVQRGESETVRIEASLTEAAQRDCTNISWALPRSKIAGMIRATADSYRSDYAVM